MCVMSTQVAADLSVEVVADLVEAVDGESGVTNIGTLKGHLHSPPLDGCTLSVFLC